MSKKINKKGASMVIALVLFLVVTTVSALIIGAASTSSGRLSEYGRQEEVYLLSASCMEVVSDELSNLDIKCSKQDSRYFYSSTTTLYGFQSFVEEGIKKVWTQDTVYDVPFAIEIPDGNAGKYVLNGQFTMLRSFDIRITFSGVNSEGGYISTNERAYNESLTVKATDIDLRNQPGEVYVRVHYGDAELGDSADKTTSALAPEEYIPEDIPVTGNYVLTFHANMPTHAGKVYGQMANQYIPYNTTTRIKACDYRINGYSFRGWSTTPDGAAIYEDTEALTIGSADTEGSGATLYAVWQALYEYPDFLSATGEQYIDLGARLINSQNARLEYAYQMPYGSGLLYGFDNRKSSMGVLTQETSSDYIAFYTGTQEEEVLSVAATGKVSVVNRIESGYQNVAVNGASLEGSYTGQFNAGNSFYLFAAYGSGQTCASAKIYYFDIYIDDILVRSLRPAVRSSDGSVGLLDFVTGILYENAGNGNFGYGND